MKKILLLLFVFFAIINSYCQEDTLFLSAPYNYTDWTGSVDGYSVASLNSSQFVVAYDKGGVWEGKVRVGNIVNDSTIVYDNEFAFSTNMSLNGIEIDCLSSNEFIITYRDNYSLKIRKGEISNGNIVLYSPYTFLNQYCYMYSVAVISPTKFIISYMDPQSDYGKCALGEISNNSINVNTSYTFSSSSIENYAEMTIDTLSNSRFVVTYGYWGGYAAIGNINQDGLITLGETYAYNTHSEDAYEPKVVSINENEFVIGYINDYNLRNGTLIKGNVTNENEITYSDKFICSPQNTANISITALTNDRLILAYDLYDSKSSSFINSAIISAESFQLNNAILNDTLSGFNLVNKLDSTKFILIYANEDNYNGISKIGSTNKFQISTRIDNFKELDISIYPNPTSQYISVNLESISQNAEILIVSMAGQIMYREFTNSSNVKLNIESLNKGIYIINIFTEKQIITKKIIKI